MEGLIKAPYITNSHTSRAAAESIRPHLDRLCRIVLDAVCARGVDGCTREELEAITGMAGNTIRPRCAKLLELKHIEPCPHGQIRRTKSGRPADVLVATLSGICADTFSKAAAG